MALIPPGMSDDPVAAGYARWLASTPRARNPDTVEKLAEKLGTSTAHLMALHNSAWWPDFVESICGTWTPGFSTAITHAVLEAVAEKAMKGDVPAAKLYLEMAGVWAPSRSRGRAMEAEEVDPKERLRSADDAELERLAGELGMGSA